MESKIQDVSQLVANSTKPKIIRLVRQSQEKYTIGFHVWDYDWNSRDDYIGTATVDLSEVLTVNTNYLTSYLKNFRN